MKQKALAKMTQIISKRKLIKPFFMSNKRWEAYCKESKELLKTREIIAKM